ncbi:MAG: hypothetical protein AAGK14_12090 [Verrucomicrobiota bacterium]
MPPDASPPPETPAQRARWILSSGGHFSIGDAFSEAIDVLGRFPGRLLAGFALVMLIYAFFQAPGQIGSYLMGSWDDQASFLEQLQGESTDWETFFEEMEQEPAADPLSPVYLVGLLLTLFGSVFYGIFFGSIWGGFYLLVLRLMRGDSQAGVGLVFAGFGSPFLQLVLTSLLVGLGYLAVFLVMGIALFVIALVLIFAGVALGDAVGTLVIVAVMVPLVLLWLLLVQMVLCLFNYAVQLVIDQGLDFWNAIEVSVRLVWRRLLQVFLWRIVATLVLMIGGLFVFACFLFGVMDINVGFLVAFGLVSTLIMASAFLLVTLADLSVYDQMFCRHLRHQP